jgi:hypothetical protein
MKLVALFPLLLKKEISKDRGPVIKESAPESYITVEMDTSAGSLQC